MLQQINLYRQESKKILEFSAQTMGKILIGIFAVMIVITLIEAATHINEKVELSKLEKKRMEAAHQLEVAKSRISVSENRELFIKEAEVLEAEKKMKKEMLNMLSQLQAIQTTGFSRYLKAMAAQVTPGAWLTDFTLDLDDHYIALQGVATKPDSVPQLIERLSMEPAFKGKMFQIFKLAVDEKTHNVTFELKTTSVFNSEEAKKKGA